MRKGVLDKLKRTGASAASNKRCQIKRICLEGPWSWMLGPSLYPCIVADYQPIVASSLNH